MRIKSVRIQNFASFDDVTVIFDGYTPLVGPNGSGKSTVLRALNIFFRETAESRLDLLELRDEDFHNKDVANPIVITVTFDNLNAAAQEEFREYARQGVLIVKAVARYDRLSAKAPVLQFGSRMGMQEFRPYFEAEASGKAAAELKEVYSGLRARIQDLPDAKTKPQMESALRAFEAAHAEACVAIDSSDQFYGFTRGSNRLARFIQWVYVPAVKDASTEQAESKNTALGKLLARTVRARVAFEDNIQAIKTEAQERYRAMLADKQAALDQISNSLAARMAEWAHPDASARLQWQLDADKAVRVEAPSAELLAIEGQFIGNVSRFGHGLQRAYLLHFSRNFHRVMLKTSQRSCSRSKSQSSTNILHNADIWHRFCNAWLNKAPKSKLQHIVHSLCRLISSLASGYSGEITPMQGRTVPRSLLPN